MAAKCAACQQPLVVEVDLEDEDEDMEVTGASAGQSDPSSPQTVPDDTELSCGCHFHWQCLLDAYQVDSCPSCGKGIISTSASGVQELRCNLNNEGGAQEGLDILPLLKEEQYLKAYPEERKARAFLEFCREGDVRAIVEMLQADGEDEDDMQTQERTIDILTYQDPIGDMQSGLHAAVQAGSREVAWLLLLLASNLALDHFPAQVFQEAEQVGIMREDGRGRTDIRMLRDADGKTAEDVAREIGGLWAADGWIGSGRLAV